MTLKTDAPKDGVAGYTRRQFLRTAAITAGGVAASVGTPSVLGSRAFATDFGRPEKTDLTIGFIPLTDCASVVMASELGLFRKYGLNVSLSKEASWAAVRDKLLLGQLDAAHVLYGLVYGAHLGIGCRKTDMAVLMNLDYNGQGITLSNRLHEEGVADGETLGAAVAKQQRRYTFAHTFPTGTHAMWLYYWLAAHGIDPLRDVKTITIPPPQMVANMRAGHMDGYCVGDPWNGRAVVDRIGYTATATQGIWRNHPEKVLGTTQEFVAQHPNTARAMIAAIIEASRYIDAMGNRAKVAQIIGSEPYVNAPNELILARMLGHYDDGRGRQWQDPDYMKFYMDGEVNYPYLSHGVWFLTQQRRWGLLHDGVDYLAVAGQVNQVGLYTEVASALGVPVPKTAWKAETLFDGTRFDPSQPVEYVNNFKIRS